MLKNISWTNFITTIVIGLAIYYLFIGIRYYSDEIKDILSGRKKIKLKPALHQDKSRASIDETSIERGTLGFENTSDEEFDETEHLIEQLKAAIEYGAGRKLIPEEFKMSLVMVLKQYPAIKYSPLRPSINELILSECDKFQITALNEREVDLLWREGK